MSYIVEIRFDPKRECWVGHNLSGPVLYSRRLTNLTSRYPSATVIKEKP